MNGYFINMKQAMEVANGVNIQAILRDLEVNKLNKEYDGKITIAIIAHATACDFYKKLRYSFSSFEDKQINCEKFNFMVVVSGIAERNADEDIDKLSAFIDEMSGICSLIDIKLITEQRLLKCSEARKLAIDNCNSKWIQFIDLGDAILWYNFRIALNTYYKDSDRICTSSPVYIDVDNLSHSKVIEEMADRHINLRTAIKELGVDYDEITICKFGDDPSANDFNEYGPMEAASELSNTNRSKLRIGPRRETRYNSYDMPYAGRYSSYNGYRETTRYSSYDTDTRYSSYNYVDNVAESINFKGKIFVKGIARGLTDKFSGIPEDCGIGNYNEFILTAVLRQPTVLSFLMNVDILKCVYNLMSRLDLHVNMGEDLIAHYLYRWILIVLNYGDPDKIPKVSSDFELYSNQVTINEHGYYLYTSHKDSMCRSLDELGNNSMEYEVELKSVILFLYALNTRDTNSYTNADKNTEVNRKLLIEKLLDLHGINIDLEYMTDLEVES